MEMRSVVLLSQPGPLSLALLAALLAAYMFGTIRSLARLDGVGRRSVLTALRLLAFLLLTALILNPAVRTRVFDARKPVLAVLVDSSWSMSLPSGLGTGRSRIGEVRSFLSRHSGFMDGLQGDYKVSWFTLADGIAPTTRDAVAGLDPRGEAADISAGLKGLAALPEDGKPDAVLVFSDDLWGSVAHAPSLPDTPSPGPRVYAVSPLAPGGVRDVWIDGVASPAISFLRYAFPLEVTVKGIGLPSATIPVTLSMGGETIAVVEAATSGGEAAWSATAVFTVTPTSTGRRVYEVSIPAVSGDRVVENNRVSFPVDVMVDKIRVLHIAGSPSWDVKFLRSALERNPGVDLVSFFILRDRTDFSFASQDELSLIPFPVNELFGSELGTFDIVVFQDFSTGPFGVSLSHLHALGRFVKDGGGAFVMVGGRRSFGGGSYGKTPVSGVLPVDIGRSNTGLHDIAPPGGVGTRITERGRSHPVMRSGSGGGKMRSWGRVPTVDGFNRVSGVREGSVTLIETAGGEPLLVLGRPGGGRSAALLTDSSWKWAFGPDEGTEGNMERYTRLWERLLLWLVDDPELREKRILAPQAVFRPGEVVSIEAWSAAGGGTEERLGMTVVTPGGESRTIGVDPIGGGRYSAELELGEGGVYTIELHVAEAPGTAAEPLDTTALIASPPARELRPGGGASVLRELAAATGGDYINTGDTPGKLEVDPGRRRVLRGYSTEPLWDTAAVLFVLAGVFSAEIILRRRWGLD